MIDTKWRRGNNRSVYCESHPQYSAGYEDGGWCLLGPRGELKSGLRGDHQAQYYAEEHLMYDNTVYVRLAGKEKVYVMSTAEFVGDGVIIIKQWQEDFSIKAFTCSNVIDVHIKKNWGN